MELVSIRSSSRHHCGLADFSRNYATAYPRRMGDKRLVAMNFFCKMSLFPRFLFLSLLFGTGPIIIATFSIRFFHAVTVDELQKIMGFALMLSTLLILVIVPIAVQSILRTYWILFAAQRRFMLGERDYRISMFGDRDSEELFRGFNAMADFANRALANALESERDAAIAKTTQMLAHDVRKPFLMLKTALDVLRSADPQTIVRKISNITAEVTRAMTSVDGLIEDVIEIGAKVAPHQEPASPTFLIWNSVIEICRIRRDAQMKFSYELKHTKLADVDENKVQRVLSNILDNAFQATQFKGNIWFKTRDVRNLDGPEMIEFCIGNSGT